MNKNSKSQWSWSAFLLLAVSQIWAAHAFAFFCHEYAHSFAAWLLGWKGNPMALHFPPLSPVVWLLQSGINENVDYSPIFRAGRGAQAALIAIGGALVGNGLVVLPLSRWGYSVARGRGRRGWALLAYWTTVAAVGNFIDYVPVRTFAHEDDLGTFERGLGWSPWTTLIVLGIPTLAALAYFLFRIQPETLRWLFPESKGKRVTVVILTSIGLFGFYGSSGLTVDDAISRQMSIVSVAVFLPLMTLTGILMTRRSAAAATER